MTGVNREQEFSIPRCYARFNIFTFMIQIIHSDLSEKLSANLRQYSLRWVWISGFFLFGSYWPKLVLYEGVIVYTIR